MRDVPALRFDRLIGRCLERRQRWTWSGWLQASAAITRWRTRDESWAAGEAIAAAYARLAEQPKERGTSTSD